jgi:hypothetical protein
MQMAELSARCEEDKVALQRQHTKELVRTPHARTCARACTRACTRPRMSTHACTRASMLWSRRPGKAASGACEGSLGGTSRGKEGMPLPRLLGSPQPHLARRIKATRVPGVRATWY